LLNNIKNILIINSGGGFGDSVQFIPLLNWLYENYPDKKIYYYANDYEKYFFNNQLKGFKKNNLEIIKNFPLYFGFRIRHFFSAKKLAKENNLEKFDLIIDNQTKLRNTLIYKNIPHKYYFSPTLNYFFCNPKYSLKTKDPHTINRIIKYLKFLTKKEVNLNYNILLENKFTSKADQILNDKKQYFGLSIVAGHKTRKKEFNKNELIKIINFFKKKFTPVYFVEKSNAEMIEFIKNNFENPFFPEHNLENEYQSPQMLIALANKMSFNLSIDNGVAHLLSLSKTKCFCFYPGNAEKFKPFKENFYTYNCKNYEEMEKLTSDKVIEFINFNL